MKKAEYLIISYPYVYAKFMEYADLFEKGKHMGEPRIISMSFNEDIDLTFEYAAKVQSLFVDFVNEGGKEFLSFMHLLKIRNGDTILVNNTVLPYLHPDGVRAISTGEKWFMLDKFLRSLGMQVETDEYKFVKKITI